MRAQALALAALVVAILLVIPAAARAADGSISGTVAPAGVTTEGGTVRAQALDFSDNGQATIAADGTYAITGLAPGQYRVDFNGPSGSGLVQEFYDDTFVFNDADPVTVIDGQDTPDISAALVVGGAIAGTVTDGTDGLENVFVTVQGSGVFRSGHTDADGDYTIEGVPAGDYRVYFSPPGNHVAEHYDDVLLQDDATPVTVAPPATTEGIDAALAEGATISGQVTDSSGAGIASVSVSASGPSSGYATTDADGFYSVTGLPAGTYKLQFQPAPGDNHIAEYYDDAPGFNSATPIVLDTGEDRENVNAALEAGAVISGVVTSTATDDPLAGVTVIAYSGSETFSAYTDGDGEYTIAGLRAGTYTVRFVPALDSELAPEYFDDAGTQATAEPITLTAGANRGDVDAALEAGGVITGTVTDTAGEPIEDVSVSASDSSGGTIAYTDGNGVYRLAGLGEGQYTLFFQAPAGANLQDEYYDDAADSSDATLVAVARGDTITGKDAELSAGTSLSGVVTDPAGDPVDGVYVTAQSGVNVGVAYTDSDGEYTVTGLPTGSYIVSFEPPSSSGLLLEYFQGAASYDEADAVELSLGEQATGIDAQLDPDATVSGTVTDTAGEPVAGAGVEALAAGGFGIPGFGPSATTDADGEYTVRGLRAGPYKLRFSAPNGTNLKQEYFDDKPDFDSGDPVTVTSDEDRTGVDASLAEGGGIRGRVQDTGGQGVAGVQVTATLTGGSLSVSGFTDNQGDYLVSGLPTGDYQVCFSPSSSGAGLLAECFDDKEGTAFDPVTVTGGAVTDDIDATLAGGGRVLGTVTDAEGDPLSGVTVSVFQSGGPNPFPVASVITGLNGTYTVPGLTTGSYKVQFTPSAGSGLVGEYHDDQGSITTATPILVTKGEDTAGIDAQLAAGASLSGTVTGAGAGPLDDVEVYVYTADTATSAGDATTDEDGNWTVGGLRGDDYVVSFVPPSGSPYVAEYFDNARFYDDADPVTLTAGQARDDIDAELTAGGAITGTVTDSAGDPVEDVAVSVYSETQDKSYDSSTNVSGVYTVDGLPADSYVVSFSPPVGSGLAAEYHDDKPKLDAADPVAVGDGATVSDIDAQLEETGSISGTVSKSDGGTFAAGEVLVTVYDADGDVVRSGFMGAGGGYTIDGLRPGGYRLEFDPGGAGYLGEFYNDKATLAAATPVTVTGGADTGSRNAVLTRAGTISGTVLDAGGQPVAGVIVRAFFGDGAFDYYPGASDGDGGYTIAGLPPGSYEVLAVSGGAVLGEWYDDSPTRAGAEAVTVATSQNVVGIDFALVAAGVISGTVTDGTDPVVGAAVVVYDAAEEFVAGASTGSDGTYRVAGLPTGSYRVLFSAQTIVGGNEDLLDEWYDNQPDFAGATAVPVTAGGAASTADAALATGGRIAGVVTGNGGALLEGAEITVYDASGDEIANEETGPDGGFLVRGLKSGSYRVRANAAGLGTEYYSDKATLETADAVTVTAPGTTDDIDLALGQPAKVSGNVTQTGGGVLEDVYVAALSADGDVIASDFTNGSGAYTIDGLTSGGYRIRFEGDDLVTEYYADKATLAAADVVTATAGSTTTGVDASLAVAPVISGTVTDTEGDPLEDAGVSLYLDGDEIDGALTDANGDYAFTVQPGSYRLGFDAEGVATEFWDNRSTLADATPITATAGQTFDADAVLGDVVPSPSPSPSPSASPSPSPTASPSPSPTASPSPSPTASPSPSPSASPSPSPSASPSPSPEPSASPTPEPSASPTPSPEPSASPTPSPEPSASPTPSPEPSASPSPEPSASPSPEPSASPSPEPSASPSPEPSASPSPAPPVTPTPTPTAAPSPSPSPTATPAPQETARLRTRRATVRRNRFTLRVTCGASGCTLRVFATIKQGRRMIASGEAGAGGGKVQLRLNKAGRKAVKKRTKVNVRVAPKGAGTGQSANVTLTRRP